MRILALLTDAFGGHGGIAKFNRDLLGALCSYPAAERVLALPRIAPQSWETLPEKLEFDVTAARGKLSYVRQLLHHRQFKPNLIICGHIHLLPFAFFSSLRSRSPIVLIVHGIEAWQPTRRAVTDLLAKRVDRFISVSKYSRERFSAWTHVPESSGFILPNSVDLNAFTPGPKDTTLLERYRIEGRKVILTLGRLAAAERYKGFDEVLEVMPELSRDIPSLTYIIAGDGADRSRLVAKAQRLGLSVLENTKGTRGPGATVRHPTPQVVFTGHVLETEKTNHYRLADAYVMPSRGEGFGIVLLEALACGIPVIGSTADASREALMEGELGEIVDPSAKSQLATAIRSALSTSSRIVSPRLETFSVSAFKRRLSAILDQLLKVDAH